MPREATTLKLKGVSNRKMAGTVKTIFTVKSLKKVLRITNFIWRVDPLGMARTNFFYSAFLSKKSDVLLLDRPLLAVTRNDVKKICHVWQLPIHPDASNQTLFHDRNRIRKQLLPTLRFYFNRQLDGTFFQFTKLTSAEQLYIEYVSQRVFPSLCVVTREYLAFQIGGLKHLPLAIRRQILKRGLERYATRSLHLFHVEQLCRFMEKKRLQSHRFLGESSLCLLPIRIRQTSFTSSDAKEKKPFRGEKKRRDTQQVEDAMLLEDKTVSSLLHQLSSLRRKKSVAKRGKQKFMAQYVKAFKRVKKASLSFHAVTLGLSQSELLSLSLLAKRESPEVKPVTALAKRAKRFSSPKVSLRESERENRFARARSETFGEARASPSVILASQEARVPAGDTWGEEEREPPEVSSKVSSTRFARILLSMLKRKAEERKEKTSALFTKDVASLASRKAREATPNAPAIWVRNRKPRLTTTSFQRPSISPSRDVSSRSPHLIKITGSDKMIKEWNFRFGMPTHKFLPTMGSLLFLEQGSPLVGQGRMSSHRFTFGDARPQKKVYQGVSRFARMRTARFSQSKTPSMKRDIG